MYLGENGGRFFQLVKKNDYSKVFKWDQFDEIKHNFHKYYEMLKEIIELVNNYFGEYPPQLSKQLENIFGKFFYFYDPMLKLYESAEHNFRNPEGNNNKKFTLEEQEELFVPVKQFNSWFDSIYTGEPIPGETNNFLSLYNHIKSLSFKNLNDFEKNIRNYRARISGFTSEISKSKEKIDRVLKETSEKIRTKTISDYAAEFETLANEYSRLPYFNVEKKWVIGKAQIAILFAFFFILVLMGLIYYWENLFWENIFLMKEVINMELYIFQVISRVVIISLLIFLISFSFKQYSIFQHLHTINRHRHNTLNAYKLFVASLEKDKDQEAVGMKQALMQEVARTIFDINTTGFISSKGNDSIPQLFDFSSLLKKSN